MTPETQRGIGAILIAFALIGIILWLAATRLAPETTLSGGGLAVAATLFVTLAVAVILVRGKKR